LPRMKEIFELIKKDLDKRDVLDKVPAGLILCGGGAQTVGMIEIAKRVFNLPVRVGEPTDLQGLVGDIKGPSYATSIGLLLYGKNKIAVVPASGGMGSILESIDLKGIGDKIRGLLKSVLP